MKEFLSPPETPKRSKSMSLHPTTDIDTRLIKQIGNYTLGAEVGSGAFGKVVLGKHFLTGETVAIKILDKMILSQTPEDYELVRQEISILKIVKHKYIVQLYEILQTPQHIFIVMEYCEGKDLMDYILHKTRLSEIESLKFFQQLINALFYLHSQNISHRDVKIDNMLLDRNKDLKLVDFGLSTKYSDDTLLDQPCGTVVYAAPEVLDGNEYHGMLADVWSSGIVLFGMTSGYLPFCDPDDEVNKKHVLEGKIELPDFFSPMLKDLLKHMLDINPITRYTLQDIREHPWFNMNDANLIPGIIIGYNLIPVDENILNLCVAYNSDRDKIEYSVRNNKYDEGSALYYLLVRKITRKGFESVSDLSSSLFIDFILNDNNLVHHRRENKRKKRENNKTKNNTLDINRNNSTASHRTNTNHDSFENNYKNEFTPSISNNKEIMSSSSKHIDDLGAAPRLVPQLNNNNNKINKQKVKKDNLLEKKKKKNKVNSVIKNGQNNFKNSDEFSKKDILIEKNKLKDKNAIIKNNNNDTNINKKRHNNSAQHRQNNLKDLNKSERNNNNKLKLKKLNNQNPNNKNNNIINNSINSENNNLKKKIINEVNKNKNKENSINIKKIEEDDNMMLYKDEAAVIMVKGNAEDSNQLSNRENIIKNEFNSNTAKISNEIRNNDLSNEIKNTEVKNKQKKSNMNKTPIKSNKKSVTKDIKEPIFSACQEIPTKYKKKYEYNNKLKNNNNQNNEKEKKKSKNKNNKIKKYNNNTMNNTIDNNSSIQNLNKEKIKENDNIEDYHGHSCKKINPSEYFKTPISTKSKDTNTSINNNSRSSYKNINSKINKRKLLEEENKKKGINTNMTSSEKFNIKNYNNKNTNNKNKVKNNHYISKSIHSTYNSKYNEMEKIEESGILFSSNKKKDYSLSRKKNNITSIQGLSHQRLESNDNKYINNIKTKYKLYERNKMSYKHNITSPINKLSVSLNNNSHSNKYNRYNNKSNGYKYGISSSMPKIKRHTEYDPHNTIYEFNAKKKNRIRLDFNPNKSPYELTSNDIEDKKKKNKLNNSVNIGKTDEKKMTRLTRYMNNYNLRQNKPRHLESSVITHRKIHSNTIRDLSYSPKQKYLNEKTRKRRIPWKIQKKGIDDKLSSESIYYKYIHKINKRNPLKPYGNKKIKNIKMKRNRNNNSNEHNRTLKSVKFDNKALNQTSVDNKFNKNLLNKTNIQYKIKNIKEKDNYYKDKYKNNINVIKEKKINKHKAKCLSNENLPPQAQILKINNNNISQQNYLNNNFSDNINTIKDKGHINYNFMAMNNLSISSVSSKKEILNNNNIMSVFDLSCLFIEDKSYAECSQILISKLKKNGFNASCNNKNKIKCSKNNINFEIYIQKINTIEKEKNNYNENKDIYYYRIDNKKGGIIFNKIISKTLLGS